MTHPQSNIIVTQSEQPNVLASSSYAMPLSCVCTQNPLAGLGVYGSGISTVPTMGYSTGQSTVYTVPGKSITIENPSNSLTIPFVFNFLLENISVDQVLRQLGVDPHSLQAQSSGTLNHPSSTYIFNSY